MTEKLEKLVAAHPVLARSIVDGAMEAVRVCMTDPQRVLDTWDGQDENGEDESWSGPHVAELCCEIEDEVRRRCADIAGGAK